VPLASTKKLFRASRRHLCRPSRHHRQLELEYEGELKGADTIARELIRTAVGRVFSKHFPEVNFQPVIQWFELGGELKLPEVATTLERCQQLSKSRA